MAWPGLTGFGPGTGAGTSGMTVLTPANPAVLPGSGMIASDNLGQPGALLASKPDNPEVSTWPAYPNWLPLRPALNVQFETGDTRLSSVLTRKAAQDATSGVTARTLALGVTPQVVDPVALGYALAGTLDAQAEYTSAQGGAWPVPASAAALQQQRIAQQAEQARRARAEMLRVLRAAEAEPEACTIERSHWT